MGYPVKIGDFMLDEVVSSLQKEIRRCNERSAAYWAHLMYDNSYAEYAWKRLMVILSEDIGLAAPPGFISDIWALYEIDSMLRKKKSQDGILHLMQAVMMMCRLKKSRIVCDFEYLVSRNYWGVDRIEDYALCQHTARGQAKGRNWKTRAGVDWWLEVGERLENRITDEDLGGPVYHEESVALYIEEVENPGRVKKIPKTEPVGPPENGARQQVLDI